MWYYDKISNIISNSIIYDARDGDQEKIYNSMQ